MHISPPLFLFRPVRWCLFFSLRMSSTLFKRCTSRSPILSVLLCNKRINIWIDPQILFSCVFDCDNGTHEVRTVTTLMYDIKVKIYEYIPRCCFDIYIFVCFVCDNSPNIIRIVFCIFVFKLSFVTLLNCLYLIMYSTYLRG